MKKCIKCGHELPDGATFCPYCETEQTEVKAAETPRVWRKKTTIAVVAVLAVALLAVVLWSALRPRIFDAEGPELNYKGYHILLSFKMGGEPHPADAERVMTIPTHIEYEFPSQLYIYKDNDTVNAREAFMETVKLVGLETSPRDGAKAMGWSEPVYDAVFPNAALKTDISYTTDCGTNDIIWTLYMKNGDRIILRQSITANAKPEKNYYAAEYDMTTAEKLQSLIEKIEEEDTGTIVSLYLPAVTYDGGVSVTKRGLFLYGSADGSTVTTFTGTVAIEAEKEQTSQIKGVRFIGSGSGTGLMATRSVVLDGCEFRGWETGAVAADGAFAAVDNCTFAGNAIGLQLNTTHSSLVDDKMLDNLFEQNGIAVHFATMPPDVPSIAFPGTVFRGNGTDIKNDTATDVDLGEAKIETVSN